VPNLLDPGPYYCRDGAMAEGVRPGRRLSVSTRVQRVERLAVDVREPGVGSRTVPPVAATHVGTVQWRAKNSRTALLKASG
jgi:hypothetical protein